MDDISINIGNYKFNYRVSAIIIHNNKILLHKAEGKEYYALLGGRVKSGESTKDALKREVLEEIGKEIEVIEPFTFIENFFEMKNYNYHELLISYKAEFKNEIDKKLEEKIENIETDKNIVYEWKEINDIENIELKPKEIKKVLKNMKYPQFLINKS